MESKSQKDQGVLRLLRTAARRTRDVLGVFMIYVVGMFALSGFADLVLIGKDLPPVGVIVFPHETHVCLAVAIVWSLWKIRSYLRTRALRATALTTNQQAQ
ncbi:hypothetical protein [Pseudomonas sp. NPDC089569]|uniref:hypothetical protein n=1 Tax=Pseudomonas sp. NPDC089569 TaxID=3390722 RepID=UPI003D04C356